MRRLPGDGVEEAVENAIVLEYLAQLASETLLVKSSVKPMPSALLDKHFLRKHGRDAYYGQAADDGKAKGRKPSQ